LLCQTWVASLQPAGFVKLLRLRRSSGKRVPLPDPIHPLAPQRHVQNMLFYHKGLRVRKNHFPLSLAPGKPRFYVRKSDHHTKVAL
jgi:hypothetical protein